MHAWQLCHLAMVVPIADAATYEAGESLSARRKDYLRNTHREKLQLIR